MQCEKHGIEVVYTVHFREGLVGGEVPGGVRGMVNSSRTGETKVWRLGLQSNLHIVTMSPLQCISS